MRTKNEHRALKNLVHRKREGEYEAMIADTLRAGAPHTGHMMA